MRGIYVYVLYTREGGRSFDRKWSWNIRLNLKEIEDWEVLLAGRCNCFGLQGEATFFVIYWETWSCRICDLATETLYGLLVFRVLLFSVGQRVEHGCCVNIFWTKFWLKHQHLKVSRGDLYVTCWISFL